MVIIPNFSPSLFSYQDGLSWHFKQSLLGKVSRLAWSRTQPRTLLSTRLAIYIVVTRDRLELLDQSIIQDLVEGNQVSIVSDQQVGTCPTRPMPSYATGEE